LNAWLLDFDWRIAAAYTLGALLFYAFARLLFWPVRLTLRLIANAALGVLLVGVFNLAGGYFGMVLPLNPVTAVISGILGLPGVAMLLALKYLVFA